MSKLEGKVAIITGAGGGQGSIEARLFVENGGRVVLTDVAKDAVDAIAKELGSSAIALEHDISSEDAWATVVKAAVDAFGTVDILVNNAGVYQPQLLAETTKKNWDLHLDINAWGAILGIQTVSPVMKAQGSGSIINIASTAGVKGSAYGISYGVSKWAVRGLSRAAARDLAGSGIRVNTVIPGLIDTPMPAKNSAEFLKTAIANIPLGRMGLPIEIAQVVLFLAGPDSSYIAGSEIIVDGGVQS
jgi:3alpha(or 20beta)-hydroxysteroid dehydrogenase